MNNLEKRRQQKLKSYYKNKEKHQEQRKQYRATPKMKKYHREYMREWRKKKPEKVLKYNKNWRDKNREKFREWQKRHREKPENKIKKRECDKKWSEGNKERKSVMDKNYRANNRDKIRVNGLRKYYKKRNAEGLFTLEEWQAKKKEFNYICPCCGKSEEELLNKTSEGLTVDHIIPLSKGGSNFISNIQPLCRSCNSKKHTKIINYGRCCKKS